MEESQGHEGKCMGEGQGDRVKKNKSQQFLSDRSSIIIVSEFF